MDDSSYTCVSPLLLLIYRRPEHTKRVLSALRQVRPRELFIAADGAKVGDEATRSLVSQTRKVVESGIDWPCEVKTRYMETHQGCKLAVSGAIQWAFDQVERLIVVEDDCVPCIDLKRLFDGVALGHLDTWDYQWDYARMLWGGVSVIPSQNLVSNIGFGREATHTFDAGDPRAGLPLGKLAFPLNAPLEVSVSHDADRRCLREVIGLPASYFSPMALLWTLRELREVWRRKRGGIL